MIPWQGAQQVLSELPDGSLARAITGYLAVLPTEEQELFWEKAEAEYGSYISYLDEIGKNDLVAKAMDMQAKTLGIEEFTPEFDSSSVFGSSSVAERVLVKTGKEPMAQEEVRKASAELRASRQDRLRQYIETAQAYAENDHAKKKRRAKEWTAEREQAFQDGVKESRVQAANALQLGS